MTDPRRPSLDDIKDMLLGQIEAVVHHFAPPAPGSYTLHGQYFTLNPGRGDRSVGSFVVRMTGRDAGRWNDFATGSRGDILDLCGLAELGDGRTDVKVSLRAARAFLGLDDADPQAEKRRAEAARRAKAQREQAARDEADKRERRRRLAHRIWLEGAEDITGTPVDLYLRHRGIRLERLPRPVRALRFLPRCQYQHTDNETGEVFEGVFPAMAAAITDASGVFQGIHRTFLDRQGGAWVKAPVPVAKKVLGNAWGHGINLWAGIGPRGGKPASLPKCPPGTEVYLTEGIEDALSLALILPEARAVAAISLGNLRAIQLPRNVARLVLIADQDEGEKQQAELARAVEAHQQAGRVVHVWKNRHGGKDLNDALRDAMQRQNAGADT